MPKTGRHQPSSARFSSKLCCAAPAWGKARRAPVQQAVLVQAQHDLVQGALAGRAHQHVPGLAGLHLHGAGQGAHRSSRPCLSRGSKISSRALLLGAHTSTFQAWPGCTCMGRGKARTGPAGRACPGAARSRPGRCCWARTPARSRLGRAAPAWGEARRAPVQQAVLVQAQHDFVQGAVAGRVGSHIHKRKTPQHSVHRMLRTHRRAAP